MREEVVGDWRRLLNVELHKLYTSPNVTNVVRVIETNEMDKACSTHSRDKKCIQYLI
jgi:hypothetical protein